MRLLRALLVPCALAILLLVAGLALATDRSPAAHSAPSPLDVASPTASPQSTSRTELAADGSAIARGYRLGLSRTVIPPGGQEPAHWQPGDQVVYVESGTLSIDTLADPMAVPDPDAEPPQTMILVAGQSASFHEDTLQVWSNPGGVPVVATSALLIDEFADAIVPVAPSAGPTPAIERRIVVKGGGADGYRMVILDRSGHVRGARLPRPAELRFAVGGLGVQANGGSAGDGRLALLQWSGTGCGPIVDIDIAADLSRIAHRRPLAGL